MSIVDRDVERVRYASRVDELLTGDQIFTPAYRWETVIRLDRGETYSASTRVFTDRTGEGYGWSLANWHELPTLRSWQIRGTATVRVDSTRHRVVAFVGTGESEYWYLGQRPAMTVLAEATPAGRGQGWDVVNRPDGGDPVRVRVGSTAAALSAVKRAARVHAKALGLRLDRCEAGGR
jgi:hypothetical protein